MSWPEKSDNDVRMLEMPQVFGSEALSSVAICRLDLENIMYLKLRDFFSHHESKWAISEKTSVHLQCCRSGPWPLREALYGTLSGGIMQSRGCQSRVIPSMAQVEVTEAIPRYHQLLATGKLSPALRQRGVQRQGSSFASAGEELSCKQFKSEY
jgi:hypothetical protein